MASFDPTMLAHLSDAELRSMRSLGRKNVAEFEREIELRSEKGIDFTDLAIRQTEVLDNLAALDTEHRRRIGAR